MIGLTRTTGEPCRLHPSEIQRVETHPGTLVYLSDGAKYAVVEDIDEIARRVRESRARAMTAVYRIMDAAAVPSAPPVPPVPAGPAAPAGAAAVVPFRSRQER